MRRGSHWSPRALSGLVLWVRSDLGITLGTGISAWADQSGNGNNLVQATGTKQPAYVASGGANNTAYSDGDATDDYLRATFTLNQPEHVFIVAQKGVPTAVNPTLMDGAAGNLMRFWWSGAAPGSDTVLTASSNGVNLLTTTHPTSFLNWSCIEAQFNGASSKLRVNDVSYTTGDMGAGNAGGLILHIFGDTTSAPSNSNIAEAIIYNRILAAAEITQVREYVRGRYGI